ncbi:MAG: 2-C-methyl-D-erythritol 4-phosphate cytidylyltransferase [Chloroflexi bacterium]|nr:2-C-methyl-D-erythritol 4-phosphate cytidylyltransferase [Chloroflexota bacterium]
MIAAAGSSRRMGFDKLTAELGGAPILAHTVFAFELCPQVDEIVLVVSRENLEWCEQLIKNLARSEVKKPCLGGERRQDSVLRGLEELTGCQWALIQDGARPFTDRDLIIRGLGEAELVGAAIAAVPVKDTIKLVDEQRLIVSTPNRAMTWAAQTPQVFRHDLIASALRQVKEEITDDAQALERMGLPVKVYMGSYDNIKITTPEDLGLAESIWRRRQRLGSPRG